MDRSVTPRGGEEPPSTFTMDGQSSDDGLAHLHDALEKARRGGQAGTRRRAVVLVALCLLLLAAGSGLGLAVFCFLNLRLRLRPPQEHGASLVRPLVLAASAMSLVYIGFHVRGARRNRLRPPGPPHFFGEYTLAGALMVSRLAIGVWAAAVVAAVIAVASGPNPLAVGLAGATAPSLSLGVLLPLLHLVVCLVAIPSFLIIAATIESQQAPFATAGLSPARPPLRTNRGDDSADAIDEHISISRRMSMQRAVALRESTEFPEKPPVVHTRRARSRSLPGPGLHPLQLGTADSRGDGDAKTELMASSPVKPAYRARPRTSRTLPPPYPVPPVPPLPPLAKIRSLPQLRNSPRSGSRTQRPSHSAIAPATGTITSHHAASSRDSSPDTTPPSRATRGRAPAIPGTPAVRATQLRRPSATRHGKRPSRARGLGSSSLMEPRGNGH